MYLFRIFILLIAVAHHALGSDVITFGNAIYVSLSLNESHTFLNRKVKLIKVERHRNLIEVDGERIWLQVSKRELPKEIHGIRIFVADNADVKNMTTDPAVHNLNNKDVFLCLSDASKPLLDPSKFIFPISRKHGYQWTMEENSHLFAFLGLSTWRGPGHIRSHEGMDVNMHEARGRKLHPLIAIESGTIVLVADSTVTGNYDGCIILKSDSQENIYYVYKHTNPETHMVKVGQKVEKGQELSYIWGDHSWGHLHFAVVYRTETPTYKDRYKNVIGFFPQFYELFFGDLNPISVTRKDGNFSFGQPYWTCNNILRTDQFDEKIGYGWQLGDWCISQKVEWITDQKTGNVRIGKTLHGETKGRCDNPNKYLDFEIAVENGTYAVNAVVGDILLPGRHNLSVENMFVADLKTEAGEFIKTNETKVKVADGRLTFRFTLDTTIAGVKQIIFAKLDQAGKKPFSKLVWSDEFNGTGLPDKNKWGYEVGMIRNRESQYYTEADTSNVRQENGMLVIKGKRQKFDKAEYTSASIITKNKQHFLYGRIEVRAKVPMGRGTWPAIWLLGENKGEVGWPECGEIDIMEHVGFDSMRVHGNVHTQAYYHRIKTNKGSSIEVSEPWNNFHVYAIEWSKSKIDFFVDDMLYFTFLKEKDNRDVWPFDTPHYLLLNLAIGGGWGGQKGIDMNKFPHKYYIDYVRVYE